MWTAGTSQVEGRDEAEGGPEGDGDGRRLEPVVLLPLLEEVLQRAQARDEQPDAPPVDVLALRLRELEVLGDDVLVLLDEEVDHPEADDADGHVDVEDPGPRVVVDDPAAERGAEGRAEHDGHGE